MWPFGVAGVKYRGMSQVEIFWNLTFIYNPFGSEEIPKYNPLVINPFGLRLKLFDHLVRFPISAAEWQKCLLRMKNEGFSSASLCKPQANCYSINEEFAGDVTLPSPKSGGFR